MLDFNKVFNAFRDDLNSCSGILTEDNIRYYLFAKMIEEDHILNHYCLELPYEDIASNIDNRFELGIKCDRTKFSKKNKKDSDPKLDLELDMYYKSDDEIVCLEVKFHRHTGDHEFPKPMSAGKLTNDFQRLKLIERCENESRHLRRLIFYVTDNEMHKYLSARGNDYRNGLSDLYNATIGEINKVINIKGAPKSFKKYAYDSLNTSDKIIEEYPDILIDNVRVLYSENVDCKSPSIQESGGSKCHIRVYELL